MFTRNKYIHIKKRKYRLHIKVFIFISIQNVNIYKYCIIFGNIYTILHDLELYNL